METPITAEREPDWTRVAQDVNSWRGASLQCFASVEAAVTETLLHLSAIPGRGDDVRLRHLVGQRLDDLAQVVGEGGAFATEGRGVAPLLAAFRCHEALRTMIAHGQAKLALERNGRWIAIFRIVSIRAKQAERSELILEERDAAGKLQELKAISQKLCSALGNFRRTLAI